jgi:hypothetical protein
LLAEVRNSALRVLRARRIEISDHSDVKEELQNHFRLAALYSWLIGDLVNGLESQKFSTTENALPQPRPSLAHNIYAQVETPAPQSTPAPQPRIASPANITRF